MNVTIGKTVNRDFRFLSNFLNLDFLTWISSLKMTFFSQCFILYFSKVNQAVESEYLRFLWGIFRVVMLLSNHGY